MKLTNRLLLPVAFVCLSVPVFAQNPCSQGTPYRGCKACGSATSLNGKKLNVLKNRSQAATNPQKITIEEMRDPANNTVFTPSRKVWITGFVASLEKGGFKETCNCKREDLRDIHINIVASPSEVNNRAKHVVVEITPGWQAKFNMDDSDYDAMLSTLRSQIEGKWVRFEGWLMSDSITRTNRKPQRTRILRPVRLAATIRILVCGVLELYFSPVQR
jgi:hypothetical protein